MDLQFSCYIIIISFAQEKGKGPITYNWPSVFVGSTFMDSTNWNKKIFEEK